MVANLLTILWERLAYNDGNAVFNHLCGYVCEACSFDSSNNTLNISKNWICVFSRLQRDSTWLLVCRSENKTTLVLGFVFHLSSWSKTPETLLGKQLNSNNWWYLNMNEWIIIHNRYLNMICLPMNSLYQCDVDPMSPKWWFVRGIYSKHLQTVSSQTADTADTEYNSAREMCCIHAVHGWEEPATCIHVSMAVLGQHFDTWIRLYSKYSTHRDL